jgi:hypothetical protein
VVSTNLAMGGEKVEEGAAEEPAEAEAPPPPPAEGAMRAGGLVARTITRGAEQKNLGEAAENEADGALDANAPAADGDLRRQFAGNGEGKARPKPQDKPVGRKRDEVAQQDSRGDQPKASGLVSALDRLEAKPSLDDQVDLGALAPQARQPTGGAAETDEEEEFEEADAKEKDKAETTDSERARNDAFGGPAGRDRDRQGLFAAEVEKPTAFLPRMAYFESNYVGGDAGYAHFVRALSRDLPDFARALEAARATPPPLDPPESDGLGLEVTTEPSWMERPGRALLMVSLTGSSRFGWRRPPLDLAVVLGGSRDKQAVELELLLALTRKLGPEDSLSVVRVDGSGSPEVVLPLEPLRRVRSALAGAPVEARSEQSAGDAPLAAALRLAAAELGSRGDSSGRVPGTRVVLCVADSTAAGEPGELLAAAHELTTAGVVTSVVEHGETGALWGVAQAGNGSYHNLRSQADSTAVADGFLDALSRVVARLVRVNIRLAPDVSAIRVLGSHLLNTEEQALLKAREEATDAQLSASMGIQADRGLDDDGLQSVMPYFLGGDSHTIFVEVWCERPGPVAEVTVKYKDMVSLRNHTLRDAAHLSPTARPQTALTHAAVLAYRSARVGEALLQAARALEQDEAPAAALGLLDHTRAIDGASPLLDAARALVESRASGQPQHTAQALSVLGQTRLGLGAAGALP